MLIPSENCHATPPGGSFEKRDLQITKRNQEQAVSCSLLDDAYNKISMESITQRMIEEVKAIV
jgi:hypothetical protein